MKNSQRTVFLDRDGTIIEEKDFIKDPQEIEFISGSIQAIKILRNLGYKIIVVSNQSGVGRGILTEGMVKKVNRFFMGKLVEKNAPVDAIYYCPHHPDQNCDCRKPQTGMLKKAAQDHKLNLENAVVIGDKLTDVKLGKNIGAKTILVLTGYGKSEVSKMKEEKDKPDFVAKNLLSAVSWVKELNAIK
jgi:D-glycero-D-manno-heptose 1,7-bisphosphate phosphatase